MLKIALFDRIDYDDLDAYGQFGNVTICTRFNHAKAASADVIITTWTKPPAGYAGIVLNMASADARHVDHLTKARIIHSKPWNTRAVAEFTLARIPDKTTVAVVGMGRIGSMVFENLRMRGHYVVKHNHNTPPKIRFDVVTLHVRHTSESHGWFDKYLLFQKNTVLINTARRGLITDMALLNAVRRGCLSSAHIDGGKNLNHPQIIITPHTAWRGGNSAKLRVKRISDVLSELSAKRNPQ